MHVFISYAREDREWAQTLRQELTQVGLEPWLDAWEIFPGDNWALLLGEALQGADAMVVLMSPAAARSESVQRDLQFAMGSEKLKGRLIPVLLQPTNEMPWILGHLNWVQGSPGEVAAKISQSLKSPAAPLPASRTRASSL